MEGGVGGGVGDGVGRWCCLREVLEGVLGGWRWRVMMEGAVEVVWDGGGGGSWCY